MGGSVRFDRAAEFYDESRAYPEDLARATTELLVAELRGRRSVLEVGVGTGLIALPLHEAGVPMRGLDISAPMVGKLIEKAGGRPFPLVIGDAAALPFSAGAVDAGLIRWVLHLIPDWRGVVAEVVRVVRPGGVLVVHLGAYGGRWEAIRRRFEQIVGVPIEPVGIGWHQEEELDTEVARHGGRVRLLPPLAERGKEQLADLLDGIERNLYSWTWPVPDHARLAAAAELRLWAQERFGPLDRPLPYETTIVWRAYDLPR
ncbi:MAG TPA: class I SAM-dependent methyltransferase [Actinomycetota bacterium]|nr:class I SAM-dependent methyltransferase [Actinomycetota bacterium]